MRVVSLLPSLTELVCTLGHRDDLVGVTHECDFPSGVESLPHLTRSRIEAGASSGEIDALVSAQGGSLYDLDEIRLESLRPDLILTQEQCDVCTVNERTVRRAAMSLPGRPHVESFNPTDLASVFAMFRRVGELFGDAARAEELVGRFEATRNAIAQSIHGENRGSNSLPPRVLILEWTDPPFCSGHWNPELIEQAGGMEAIGQVGERSRRVPWEDISQSRPDVIIVAPCGFTLDRAREEARTLRGRPEWDQLPAVREGRVVIVDGSSYFSRPGPRLDASLRIAAAAIHPEHCRRLAPPEGQGWEFLPVGG